MAVVTVIIVSISLNAHYFQTTDLLPRVKSDHILQPSLK